MRNKVFIVIGAMVLFFGLGAQNLKVEYKVPPKMEGMRDITATEISKELGPGWNLGNTLESTGGETNWGNPKASKRLIDSVKAAGFNMVRIPVAWSVFSNEKNYVIEDFWKKRVEDVVNYALDNGMYAMLNLHWDGGWLDEPTYANQKELNNRLRIMWDQIATHFRDYDDHLLFAGTNEVRKEGDWGDPTVEYYTVQNGYNQVFVETVRATGGANAYRHLIVQSFNTNVNYALNFFKLPKDVVQDKLMLEVHYYEPWTFTINEESPISQWGKDGETGKAEAWGGEIAADDQFKKLKTKFVDKGVPVIVGEYGAISKDEYKENKKFRTYWMEYITNSMVENGLVPVYWDNGYTHNHAFGLFNRNNGKVVHRHILDAIMKAYKK